MPNDVPEQDDKTLYLHIGLPKTATSYIQQALFRNRDYLLNEGVWTPSDRQLSHRFACETLDNERKTLFDVKAIMQSNKIENFMNQVNNALASNNISKLIISSEYLSESNKEKLKNYIYGLAKNINIKVLIFIRRQDKLIQSLYSQEITAMGRVSVPSAPGYNSNLDNEKIIQSWEEVFGEGQVIVVGYDKASRENAILSYLFAAIGASSLLADGALPEATHRENERLPADLLEFKRLANQFGEFGLSDWLYKIASEAGWAPAYGMPDDAARRYREIYEESNRRVVEKYMDGDEANLLLNEDIPPSPENSNLAETIPVETVCKLLAANIKSTRAREKHLLERIEALETRLQNSTDLKN